LIDLTELRQAQRQRDEAIRFLCHDFRAPQASILTALSLHRHDPASMTLEQFYDRIERHAKRSLSLSDDFVQLVRAEADGYRLEPCNLVDILLECVDDAWETMQQQRIVIETRPLPAVAEALVDRELVGRAIANLIGNALKYSPEGTVVVCGIEAHGEGWAVLVRDQGPGIAEDARENLFEPFSRGRDNIRIDGAGLGLAFVRTVAKRQGGSVQLESTPGHGSTFRLILPRL
jgi:signal transduction histidine kinase